MRWWWCLCVRTFESLLQRLTFGSCLWHPLHWLICQHCCQSVGQLWHLHQQLASVPMLCSCKGGTRFRREEDQEGRGWLTLRRATTTGHLPYPFPAAEHAGRTPTRTPPNTIVFGGATIPLFVEVDISVRHRTACSEGACRQQARVAVGCGCRQYLLPQYNIHFPLNQQRGL
jgi:hypothetical protein